MMSPSEYVDLYLKIPLYVDDEWAYAQVKYYLQAEYNTKSNTALTKKQRLVEAMQRKKISASSVGLSDASVNRVYIGKGSPREIQGVLTLVIQCGLENAQQINNYTDPYLGVDCGGFVANYWGIGMPEGATAVYGQTGILPRDFWTYKPNLQRRDADQIQSGDAAIFFKDVKDDNPDNRAVKGANNKWDPKTGSQAHHIGLVHSFSNGGERAAVIIADSAGDRLADGSELGVKTATHSWPLGKDKTGRVFCDLGSGERVYFVAPYQPIEPYGLQYYRNIPDDPRPAAIYEF